MTSLNFREQLERDISQLNRNAIRMEKWFIEKMYKLDYFITLTFKKPTSDTNGIKHLAEMLQRLSYNNNLGGHLFWCAYYDRQPEREEYSVHFHLFLECPDNVSKARICRLIYALWSKHGSVEHTKVEIYDDKQFAVVYSKMKHKGFVDGVACPGNRGCDKRKCKFCKTIGELTVFTEEWFERQHRRN